MVVVATDDGGTPCGACRQVMTEFSPRYGRSVTIVTLGKFGQVGIRTILADFLLQAFRLDNAQ